MTRFKRLALFLAKALEYKYRFPKAADYPSDDPVFRGRWSWTKTEHEMGIIPLARQVFKEYGRYYLDDKEFVLRFVLGRQRRDPLLERVLADQTPTTAEEEVLGTGVEEMAKEKEVTSAPRITLPSTPQATASQVTAEKEKVTPPQQPEIPQTPPPSPSPPQTADIPITTPPPPQVPPGITNLIKNISSNTGIFFKKNVSKYLTFGNLITGIFTALGGIGGAVLTKGGVLGTVAGAGAGAVGSAWLRSSEGSRSLLNFGSGAISRTVNFSNQFSTQSLFKGPPKKVWIGFLVGFLILTAIGGAILPIPGQEQPGAEAAPVAGLDYTLPLKDPTIIPLDIKDKVKKEFPGAKLEYWDDPIIKRSVAEGWNPALVLALWIEETGASQTTLIQNGGSGIPFKGNLSKGHLGCAPLEDQTINESLTCLFKFGAKFTNHQFPEFMAAYSGGPANDPFSNNPNFPANLKDWYTKLVPQGPGAITPLAIGICPAVARITTPYGYNIANYPDVGNEDCNLPRCHNGIDIGAQEGDPAKAPISGIVTVKDYAEFKGNYIEISDDNLGIVVTLEHLQTITKNVNDRVSAGDIVGTVGKTGTGVTGPVLHLKIKKGGKLINPFKFLGSNVADLHSQALILSDDIQQNNYANTPAIDNWGYCAK